MIKELSLIFLFFVSAVKQDIMVETAIHKETDLKELSDNIVSKVHDQMREALELRQRKFPNSRNLIDVDMKKQILIEKGDNSVIFGFGWNEGKFMRCYSPMHYELSKPLNDVPDTSETEKIKFYNRYAPRPLKPQQMQCMLYATIGAIQYIEMLRMIEFEVVFRSPCMKTVITRIFTVSETYYMPVVVELKFQGETYLFEFDEKLSYTGHGQKRKSTYSQYKLLNFYVAVVNWMRKPILPDPALALQRYEKSQQSRNNTETGAGGLGPRMLQVSAIDDPSSGALLPVITDEMKMQFKGKKGFKMFRKLYRNYSYSWLPYKQVGVEEILKSKDSKIPYFEYEVINAIWEANNPTQCTISTTSGTTSMSWNTNYAMTYGSQQNQQSQQYPQNQQNQWSGQSYQNSNSNNNSYSGNQNSFNNNQNSGYGSNQNSGYGGNQQTGQGTNQGYQNNNQYNTGNRNNSQFGWNYSAVNTPVYYNRTFYKISCNV